MTTENLSQSTENTEPAVNTQDTATPAATPNSEVTSDPVSSQADGGTPPPAYTPNFKFKVLDKEHEFDPIFRPLIKDAETEKKIKEFHEKAFGLDSVKTDRDRVKEEYKNLQKTFKEKYEPLDKDLQAVGLMIKNDDWSSVFKQLGVDETKIFQWVERRIEEMSLPPEKQQFLKQQEQERSRLYTLEQQNQMYQKQLNEQMVQARTSELTSALERPEVKQFAETYEAKAGPNTFKQAVIDHGIYFEKVHGKVLTPAEAVQGVMERYGVFFGAQANQPMNHQAQAPGAKPVPVIPAVSGKGASPIKQGVKSLADLKQRYNELN